MGIIPGMKTSQLIREVLTDLIKIKGESFNKLNQKNDILPFKPESKTTLHFLCAKSSRKVFCLATHLKKRPHNLTFGRISNSRKLELIEFGVLFFKSISSFKVKFKKPISDK